MGGAEVNRFLHIIEDISVFCDATFECRKSDALIYYPIIKLLAMTQVTDYHSDNEEDSDLTHLPKIFAQIETLIRVEDFYSFIRSESYLNESKEKAITPKMRTKLLTWLQKLALNTFKFHSSTFITAVFILDQYLQKNDESPSNLQLLGCTSLFIASKLCQAIIIAPQCYATACCNIYSKKQLLQKQRIVYTQISWKKIRSGLIRAVRLGSHAINAEHNLELALQILGVLIREERFCLWKQSKLVCSVLSLAVANEGKELSSEEIINMADDL